MPSYANLRLVLWFTLISIVLSAILGYLQAEGGDQLTSLLRGGFIGALICSILSTFELFVFTGGPFNRAPFLMFLAARSAVYTVVILFGLAAGSWLTPADVHVRIFRQTNIIFSVVLSVGFNMLLGINRLVGQSVLFNFAAGRYHRPRVEQRVLLFIDMEGSTAIAEKLGEIGFLKLLKRFVADITGPIVAQRGEIHKYIGDELIVTWPLALGLSDGRCVRACFDALAQLDMLAGAYLRDFARRANFRAALHCGPVVIGELGVVKMEIAFLGDTMNTAARIQQACRDTGCRVLASAALVARIAALPPGITKRSLGAMPLRGKATELELYALDRATESAPAAVTVSRISVA
jgi:adenylate cyclase